MFLRRHTLYTTLLRWQQALLAICRWHGLPWTLFALSIVRNVVLLLAYPPASHGDSRAYFLYAERFTGYSTPDLDLLTPPLYPVFIFLTFKVLGSIYWLVALQFLASALLAPLTYLGLKRYSPVLASIASLVVLGDFQTAIIFNFISTEPLYVFLLVVTLFVFLHSVDGEAKKGWSRAALSVGVLLVLLMLTRAVARYLIIPLAVVLLLRTWDWRRLFSLMAGYAGTMMVYSLAALLLFGQVESRGTSNVMLLNFIRETNLVSSENGTNSRLFLIVDAECPAYPYYVYRCLEGHMESWDAGAAVVANTYIEAALAHPVEYLQIIWRETMNFLALTGQQYGLDPQTPSEATCDDPEAYYILEPREMLHSNWGLVFPDISDTTLASFRGVMRPIVYAMCPPLPDVDSLRPFVNTMMERYRSLGRPAPYLWYGALLAIPIVFPWARRYLSIVLAGVIILLNHAVITAMVYTVHPRYVVVINPIRALLLSLLVHLVCLAGVKFVGFLRRGENTARLDAELIQP